PHKSHHVPAFVQYTHLCIHPIRAPPIPTLFPYTTLFRSIYCARAPACPRTPPAQPYTASPGRNAVTASPTASTTPLTSTPSTPCSGAIVARPARILVSIGLKPAASTRNSTCCPTGADS